jgi:NitT/TauT family transport system substrate-binding protein
MIAAEKRFFAEEGLDARLDRSYPSGKRALAAMLEGEVEMTISSEVPLAFQAFERDDFRIVATVGSSDNEPRIIGRREGKIEQPEDLRGKRIATQRGSAVHYFLHLFLLKNQIDEDDVVVSFLQAEELPQALAEGKIDAFSMREPFIGQARSLLADNAIVFQEPGLYVKTMNLVARQDVVEQNAGLIEKVLRSLLRAESFLREHPDEARRLIADQLVGDDPSQFAAILPQMTLEMSLGHSLVLSLEDEARWAVGEGLVEGEEPPDYVKLLYLDAIKQVKPAAVTVIE